MVCEGGGGKGRRSCYGYNIESSEAEMCDLCRGFNFGGEGRGGYV